jgi:predicted Zn-dependent protease
MSLNLNKCFKIISILSLSLLIHSCASQKPEKTLTLMEQINVDTESAHDLSLQFQKKVHFLTLPQVEKFLARVAVKVLENSNDLMIEKIRIKLYADSEVDEPRVFTFPGTLIVIPLSLVQKVQFENELAAMLALEIAHIINRHLVNHIEELSGAHPTIFGEGSVFEYDKIERTSSINLAVKLLNQSGFDTRGMASIFSRYPEYYFTPSSDFFKKEVEFNVKVAQKAKNEYVPILKPIVRSENFIQFKKDLERVK